MSAFSTMKLFFSPFHTVVFKRSHYMHPIGKSWKVMFYLLKEEVVSTYIIWNLGVQEICLSCHFLIYLIISFYQNELVDIYFIFIYFILSVLIEYYFIYIVAQSVPFMATGHSFSCLLCPFYILPLLCVYF